MFAEIQDKAAWVWAFQVATSVAALGLCVFGVGLRRRLDEQEPVGSLSSNLAMVGLLLAAGLSLVGGAISTQLFWWLQGGTDEVDPTPWSPTWRSTPRSAGCGPAWDSRPASWPGPASPTTRWAASAWPTAR